MIQFNKYVFYSFVTLGIAALIDTHYDMNILESNIQLVIILLVLFSGIFAGMTLNVSKKDALVSGDEQ